MGIEVAMIVGGALSAATAGYGAYQAKRAEDGIDSEADLRRKADAEAEKKRLARAGGKDSETMFASKTGVAGIGAGGMGATDLKKDIGA